MDTVNDLDLAHGAEVEIEVHAPPRSVAQHAGLLLHGQQPLQQTTHAPGRPLFSQAPTAKLTARPTVSSSARFSAPSTGCTLGMASSTPSGPQLGTGLPLGAAAAGVTHPMYSNMAPPVPSALPGGWYQPGSFPSFGQQLPWPAYPQLNFPMVCITLIIDMHYPLPYGFGSCLVT